MKSKSIIIFKFLFENDLERCKFNIDWVKKIFGWELRVDLEEGLKRIINYFKELFNRWVNMRIYYINGMKIYVILKIEFLEMILGWVE